MNKLKIKIGYGVFGKAYEDYVNLIKKAGVVHITKPSEMSRTLSGEAHDGQYPLRLYTNIVEHYKP